VIAALLPQQPVQARTRSGDLIWQHIPCGWPHPWHPDAEPDTGPDSDPAGCHMPGPWRPLLVGGNPAPEPAGETYDEQTLVKVYDALKRAGLSEGQSINAVDEMQNLGLLFRERLATNPAPEPDLMAQVMAERDEARAEVERLKAPAPLFTNGKGEIHVTAVLDEQGTPRLAVQWPPGVAELADPEYGALRSQIAHLEVELAATQQMLNVAMQRPDPLVLSLPTVPEGAILVGGTTGRRYVLLDGWWRRADGETDYSCNLFALLSDEGTARVEMAPPREPRTWPKLDGAPEEMTRRKVRGASGTVYALRYPLGNPVFWHAISDFELGGTTVDMPFAGLQQIDGPLTEVFDDEPGGEQR
jgi:hypothetical protein